MDATPSPTQVDSPRVDPVSVALADAKEILSKLRVCDVPDRPHTKVSDLSPGLRETEPSPDAAPRPVSSNNDPLPSRRSSVSRRAFRRVTRFLMAACIGAAATLAWQSYGDAAKQEATETGQPRSPSG